MQRFSLVLSLAFLLPSIGRAQHSGSVAASGTHISVAPAPVAAPHMVASVRPAPSARPVGQPNRVNPRLPVAPRNVHPSGWNTGTHRRAHNVDHRFDNGNFASNCFPVPGLGFDFPHFFATHPNFGNNCQFGSGFVVPFIDGGFYLPTPFNTEQGAPQPAVEAAAEQPAPPEEPADRGATFAPSFSGRIQPVPNQQEYVFVKRDGTLIFAVAYSWISDRLQYVTSEGIRRTIPRNTLDLDATQQFNDQRGVPIQLPA